MSTRRVTSSWTSSVPDAPVSRQRHVDRAGPGGPPFPPRGGTTPGGQVPRRPVSFGHRPDQLVQHLADNVVGVVGPHSLECGPLEDQSPNLGHQRLDQCPKVAGIPARSGLMGLTVPQALPQHRRDAPG